MDLGFSKMEDQQAPEFIGVKSSITISTISLPQHKVKGINTKEKSISANRHSIDILVDPALILMPYQLQMNIDLT